MAGILSSIASVLAPKPDLAAAAAELQAARAEWHARREHLAGCENARGTDRTPPVVRQELAGVEAQLRLHRAERAYNVADPAAGARRSFLVAALQTAFEALRGIEQREASARPPKLTAVNASAMQAYAEASLGVINQRQTDAEARRRACNALAAAIEATVAGRDLLIEQRKASGLPLPGRVCDGAELIAMHTQSLRGNVTSTAVEALLTDVGQAPSDRAINGLEVKLRQFQGELERAEAREAAKRNPAPYLPGEIKISAPEIAGRGL